MGGFIRDVVVKRGWGKWLGIDGLISRYRSRDIVSGMENIGDNWMDSGDVYYNPNHIPSSNESECDLATINVNERGDGALTFVRNSMSRMPINVDYMDVDFGHESMHLPGKILYFKKSYVSTDIHADDRSHSYVELRGEEDGADEPIMGRVDDTGPSKKKVIYTPTWASPAEFEEIVISSTMGSDHLPNNLAEILREALTKM